MAKYFGSRNRTSYDVKNTSHLKAENSNARPYSITRGIPARQGPFKKIVETSQNKEFQHCEHCGMNGHTMASCFKIHGYPDWYKTLRNRKKSSHLRTYHANVVVDSPLDYDVTTESNHEDNLPYQVHIDNDFSTIIQREIAKYLKDTRNVVQAHFSQISFAGNFSTCDSSNNLTYNSTRDKFWIIDTRTFNHMFRDIQLLIDIKTINPPIPIFY